MFYCSLLVTCAMAIYNTIYAPTRCMHFKHLTVKMFSFGYCKSILNTANRDRMYFDIMEWIKSHVKICKNIKLYVILACILQGRLTLPYSYVNIYLLPLLSFFGQNYVYVFSIAFFSHFSLVTSHILRHNLTYS